MQQRFPAGVEHRTLRLRDNYATDKGHKSTVECSKQMSDSEVTRGFCPQHTIWQRIMKTEGDNSCHCSTSADMNPVYTVRKQELREVVLTLTIHRYEDMKLFILEYEILVIALS